MQQWLKEVALDFDARYVFFICVSFQCRTTHSIKFEGFLKVFVIQSIYLCFQEIKSVILKLLVPENVRTISSSSDSVL